MNYRKFGNTGEKISALGFGCMRFPEYEKDGKMYVDQDKVDEMVAEAYRQGVNYFDTAPKYCNCNSEEAVGRAVKGFRDKVLLSTKIPLDVCRSLAIIAVHWSIVLISWEQIIWIFIISGELIVKNLIRQSWHRICLLMLQKQKKRD